LGHGTERRTHSGAADVGYKAITYAAAKIISQVDRIAEARAELEKAHSRMLVNFLRVLNADRWSKLALKPKDKSPK
jgi:hypothetical protein